MGTPDFAKIILEALHNYGRAYDFNICGVVTQTDKPKGRGYETQAPPVKIYAEQNHLAVYQPKTLRDEAFYGLLHELSPDIIVVAAYGKILPLNVLGYPKYGCVNVHASLLPKYRGAAPIQRAVINGEKKTGVTIMQMYEGIDVGSMLMSEEIDIAESDDYGTLHDKLAALGAKILPEALKLIEAGEIIPVAQDPLQASHAGKIEKNDRSIDFSMPAYNIYNLIRGLSPVPLAYAELNGKTLKIVSARVIDGDAGLPFGTVAEFSKNMIITQCGEKMLGIETVVPEGKNKMSASDFINGRQVSVGDMFNKEKI